MTDDLDEALEETFPASDPPANTPETGIRIDGDPSADAESNPEPAKPAEPTQQDSSRSTNPIGSVDAVNTRRTRRPDSSTTTARQAPQTQ
jgi:hypothetical protein